MLVETGITVSVSGLKSFSSLKTGEYAYKEDAIAGSGIGNIKKTKKNINSKKYNISDPNLIPKKIRYEYEEIKLGRGTPRIDPKTGKQKVFKAKELSINSGGNVNSWEGSLEWDVPGTLHRILQKPDGSLGYVIDHDYSKPRLFPGPWYPEGGK